MLKIYQIAAACLATTCMFAHAEAALITVDPDGLSTGTSLTNAFPGVTITSGTGLSDVVAIGGLTGTQQFGHNSPIITRFNRLPIPPAATLAATLAASNSPNGILRFEFAAATDFVAIDLIPNDGDDPGSIAAFDAAGNLIGSVSTLGTGGSGVRHTLSLAFPESARCSPEVPMITPKTRILKSTRFSSTPFPNPVP